MSSSIVLEKFFSDDVCTLYRGRALVVIAWRSTPTVVAIGSMSQVLFSAVRGNPGDTLVCAMIDTEVPMPDTAAREALQAGIRRLGVLRGAVNVISGTGFRAAAMRGMLSGFAMLIRPKYPTSFVGTAGEAAAFLVANWPEGDPPVPSRSDLAAALTEVMPIYAARKTA